MLTRLSYLTLLVGFFVACQNAPDKPTPPDMSALLTRYQSPDGTFTEDTAPALVDRVVEKLHFKDALQLLTDITDELQKELEEETDDGSANKLKVLTNADEIDIEGDGFIEISRICRGWQPEPIVDAKTNGTLNLVMGFSDSGLDPIAWGDAHDCHERTGSIDSELLLDGYIRLFIGNNLVLSQAGDADLQNDPVLMDLQAAVTASGITYGPGNFDLRICPTDSTKCDSGKMEFSVLTEADGYVIFYLDASQSSGGFRAENGDFSCTFGGDICAVCDGPNGSFELPELCLFGEGQP